MYETEETEDQQVSGVSQVPSGVKCHEAPASKIKVKKGDDPTPAVSKDMNGNQWCACGNRVINGRCMSVRCPTNV